jgi:hypothetical protein
MVQFGARPSTGTLFRASQFLSEELPIRLAHRVQELGDLPEGLNEMPSIQRVQDWYAQSFEVRHLRLQPFCFLISAVHVRFCLSAGVVRGGGYARRTEIDLVQRSY